MEPRNFAGIRTDDPPPPYEENPPPYGFIPPPEENNGFTTQSDIRGPPPLQRTIVQHVILGKDSRRIRCPHCHADIVTRLKFRDGSTTHIAALLLCVIGGMFCCWIPYCVDDCKDAYHECPNCNMFIGSSHQNWSGNLRNPRWGPFMQSPQQNTGLISVVSHHTYS